MRYHTLEEHLANVKEHKDAMAQRELDLVDDVVAMTEEEAGN